MARHFLLSGLLAAATFAPFVLADTCSTIAAQSTIEIEQPLSLSYEEEQTEYWSTASGALRPTCILAPKSAAEVAAIVKVLNGNNETFAIKSGGHNPNNYWNSIAGGPLISTKRLNEVILDQAASTVRIGPGNRWDDVSKALDGTGYTVVGGRIGNVGVGGYMLGGGFSFLSTQYGWAANQIISMDVVLANGTIVIASATQNSDLYAALKGGGNTFGIVTSYLLQAYPQGTIWGGNYVFNNTPESSRALLKALRDFTEYYPDEKAAIILTAETTLVGAVDLWIMFLYYNGPTPPPGVFDNFTAVGPFLNTCKSQSLNSLLTANNAYVVRGSVYTIATETTPNPNKTVGVEVLESYYNHWRNVSKPVLPLAGAIASVAFQPLPKSMARIAKQKGGDLLDLDDSVDRIILEFDYSFLLNSDYPKVDVAVQNLYSGIRSRVQAFQQQGKLPNSYLPLFLNDLYFREDYWGRIKASSAALARRVQQQVDPNGLWAKRTGGTKL